MHIFYVIVILQSGFSFVLSLPSIQYSYKPITLLRALPDEEELVKQWFEEFKPKRDSSKDDSSFRNDVKSESSEECATSENCIENNHRDLSTQQDYSSTLEEVLSLFTTNDEPKVKFVEDDSETVENYLKEDSNEIEKPNNEELAHTIMKEIEEKILDQEVIRIMEELEENYSKIIDNNLSKETEISASVNQNINVVPLGELLNEPKFEKSNDYGLDSKISDIKYEEPKYFNSIDIMEMQQDAPVEEKIEMRTITNVERSQRPSKERYALIDGLLGELDKDINNRHFASSGYASPNVNSDVKTDIHLMPSTTERSFWQKVGDKLGVGYSQAKEVAKGIIKSAT